MHAPISEKVIAGFDLCLVLILLPKEETLLERMIHKQDRKQRITWSAFQYWNNKPDAMSSNKELAGLVFMIHPEQTK